ncbi:MAG: hypothetical protein ACM31C_06275 [Acidobacteriota bacterium]
MRWLPLLAALVAAPPSVRAAPAADVVVVWAPGMPIGPVQAVARAKGAAVVDRSPAPPAAIETAKVLKRGIDAYDALKFDEARAVLDQTRDLVDRTGAAGLTTGQLSDLFLYRGIVRIQLGDESSAWDELRTAIVIEPARELDRGRFPPKVVELFDRARDETMHRQAAGELQVDAPPGCTAYIDDVAAPTKVQELAGSHWVRVDCADRPPWGQRIDLTAAGMHLRPDPAPYAPPTEEELLVQARVAGARALVVAEVHGKVATARLIGLDGRERDRRSVTVDRDLKPLADVVDELLTPAARPHWYESKWAWAGGAAALAAIVLVPITAAIAGQQAPTTFTTRPKGLPPL